MTSPLDEISFKLGQLNAGQAMLIARAEKRDTQMEQMTQSLSKIENQMAPLAEDVSWMKPQVRHYSTHRKRVAWIASFLFTFGGTVGGFVGNYLMKKFQV